MIYVTEKKLFCAMRFHYSVKILIMIVPLAHSHWKNLRIMPVKEITENTLLFFIKHEGYIDWFFQMKLCHNLRNISFSKTRC